MTSKLPPSCSSHFGFPLPCVRCAPMPDIDRREDSRPHRMRPPCTTIEARRRRLQREDDIAATRHDVALAAVLGVVRL